jgi:hypothetical protein
MDNIELSLQGNVIEALQKLERLIAETKQDVENGLFYNTPDDAYAIKVLAEQLLINAEDLIEAGGVE